MFRFFHGDISGLIVAIVIIVLLVRLSSRASGYTRGTRQRRNLRGGMFGPFFWGGFWSNHYGQRNNFDNNPYDPTHLNNPGANGAPPSNSYNPNPNNNPNPGNNYYAPPGSFYQPGTPPPSTSSFNWPQPTENTTTSTSTAQPSAANTVRGWEMPNNQAVLKEAFVWVRSIAGWNFAGKVIVDGSMSRDEVNHYAKGKFGVVNNDLVAVEAPSYDDARRVFESYHLQ